MTIELGFFYAFAGITLISALMIIFSKNVLYSAICLLGTLLGMAALYVFTRADFLAVTQIMVYVGGILILLIFGIMFTNKKGEDRVYSGDRNKFIGIAIGIAYFVLLVTSVFSINFQQLPWIKQAMANENIVNNSTVNQIGINLMTDSVFPLEIAGFLLLVALIGAAFISGKKV
ncbi:NADH-quinone oxidoreductase subunit J family protein [Flexithrix dorotheae]|uniref:NADH-quinone oxidoreductase subunit J family protein n=1 Tax=Flexithrix dorotheae TaxID=70993 RepID=UPI000362F40C|nr:NADH-quinone oxidoreductase subunit J [Flexithrix dorotheae]